MNALQRKLVGGLLVAVVSCSAAQSLAQSHVTRPAPPKPPVAAAAPVPTAAAPIPTAPVPTGPPQSQASIDAERAAIWNSPNMLRARAWLQEYCATSAKVKPGEAQQYLNELEHMSPIQMKLWLMKFDEEEDQKQEQRAFWKQAQATAMKQAKSSDAATQKSYAAIETEETGAANQEQSQVNEQEANEQQNQDDKEIGPAGRYGPGYYPGAAGGIHYHFHMSPY